MEGTMSKMTPVRLTYHWVTVWVATLAVCVLPAVADTIPLAVQDPNLQATTYVGSGLSQPIGIVFLGPNDAFVLEKASGQVKRVINSVVQPTAVLVIAVNSNSERVLLS